MDASRAALIESGNGRRPKRPSSTANRTISLMLSDRPARGRVQHLVDLACTIMEEARSLARDSAFTEVSTRLTTLDVEAGIDYYDQVRQFETGLIKLALEHTKGNQARAAKLLRIRATTLNSKIKLYGIDY